MLPVFQLLRIMFRLLAPPLVFAAQVKLPHHAAEEPIGPMRPLLALMPPLPLHGVHREEVGVALNERLDLPLGELQSGGVRSGLLGRDHCRLNQTERRIERTRMTGSS